MFKQPRLPNIDATELALGLWSRLMGNDHSFIDAWSTCWPDDYIL